MAPWRFTIIDSRSKQLKSNQYRSISKSKSTLCSVPELRRSCNKCLCEAPSGVSIGTARSIHGMTSRCTFGNVVPSSYPCYQKIASWKCDHLRASWPPCAPLDWSVIPVSIMVMSGASGLNRIVEPNCAQSHLHTPGLRAEVINIYYCCVSSGGL